MMKPIPPTPPKQFIKKALILKEFTNLDIPIDEFEKIKSNPDYKHYTDICVSGSSNITYGYYDDVDVDIIIKIIGYETIENPNYEKQNIIYLRHLDKYKIELSDYEKSVKINELKLK